MDCFVYDGNLRHKNVDYGYAIFSNSFNVSQVEFFSCKITHCANMKIPADLVAFTKEVLDEKLRFLCSDFKLLLICQKDLEMTLHKTVLTLYTF